MSARTPLISLLLAVATMAACGDDGDRSDVSSGSTSSSTAVSTSAPATVVADPPGFSTTPVSVAAPAQRALLRSVRAEHHPGFDRVVFEFENSDPGYEVRYVSKPVTADGSGDEVAIAGSSVLQVRMENASGADLQGENVRQTYTGPRRITPSGTKMVSELAQTGDFEAVLTWVAGTKAEAAYKVAVLDSPARLVIDIAAP